MVAIALPPFKNKFAAFVAVPPVVPQVNVAVTLIEEEKPPVPDEVNDVAFVISNTVVADVP